jgi:hypothetical protein
LSHRRAAGGDGDDISTPRKPLKIQGDNAHGFR